MGRRRGQGGQAAVEVVALLPALVVLVLAGWQAVTALQAWHLAHEAARAGVRAKVVGAPADRAARAVLPAPLAREALVRAGDGDDGPARTPQAGQDLGGVTVSLPVRALLPGLPDLGRVTAIVGAGG